MGLGEDLGKKDPNHHILPLHTFNLSTVFRKQFMSVAVIGSSGGGTATLGHTDAGELLRTIHQELKKTTECHGIVKALFCSLQGGKGFDGANSETDVATLFSVDGGDCQLQVVQIGVLKDVNESCRKLDVGLATQIQSGEIQGLICISCNIDIHEATLRAAAAKKIPVTGSGGTSLSAATSKYGIQLVGNAGGSVATTSYTRAVSYTHALAVARKRDYQPFSSSQQSSPQWTSVLNACLPAFWGVAIACRGIELSVPQLTDSTWLEGHLLALLQTQALPTVCCVVMATSLAPHHGSTALMAAAVASVVCQKSILGGLLAGWLVASCVGRVLYQCIVWNIPATMTNLVVAGGVGSTVAVLISPFIEYLQIATEWVRWGVHFPMDGRYPGLGFVIGALFCWGSKVGYYHSICLPVILIEMELGAPSLWGAVDEATLVLVSAGICCANLVWSQDRGDAETSALCRRGLRINLLFGDFIEVAYPFMEKSTIVNVAGYVASGVATELLTGDSKSVLSSAYLPLPVAIWLSSDWSKVSLVYVAAFSIAFLGTLISNIITNTATPKIGSKAE